MPLLYFIQILIFIMFIRIVFNDAIKSKEKREIEFEVNTKKAIDDIKQFQNDTNAIFESMQIRVLNYQKLIQETNEMITKKGAM